MDISLQFSNICYHNSASIILEIKIFLNIEINQIRSNEVWVKTITDEKTLFCYKLVKTKLLTEIGF